jgi:ribosomal protein S17E
MNKWYNYGKWRHPEKRKELMKDREEKITADTRLNRLKEDIQSEFDKIKWMIDEYTQLQNKQIKFRDELIGLLTNQVMDLTMMSKIELGDDVITEIKRLKNIINE